MNSYRIKHTVEIVMVAKDEETALKDAYSQEFKSIDELEFKCRSKIVREK